MTIRVVKAPMDTSFYNMLNKLKKKNCYNNNNNNKLYLKKVQLYKNQFSNANLTLGLLFNCYRPLITNLLLKLHIKLDISTTSTNKSRTNK